MMFALTKIGSLEKSEVIFILRFFMSEGACIINNHTLVTWTATQLSGKALDQIHVQKVAW